MKLLTPLGQAEDVKARYHKAGRWPYGWHKSHPEQIAKVLAFGEDPSPEQIAAALYPGCIADCQCSECGQTSPSVVRLGKSIDCDDVQEADICLECLKKAVALLSI